MFEPVAVPVSTEISQESISERPSGVVSGKYLDDSTQNHLSYKASNGVPFIIDYLGIRDFYETNPEITQMARELHEGMVSDDNGISIAETKQILDIWMQELNLQANDAGIYKLKKLHTLQAIKNKYAEIEKKKLSLLASNI
jgi:hypothetical protein